MKLKYVILYVPDVAAALGFYEAAFGLMRRMLHEGGDYAEVETGETVLAFSAHDLIRSLGKTPGQADAERPIFEIALETLDVAAAVERAMSAGARLISPPTEQPWGQTIAYVSGPDGHLVELCTPVTSQP